MGFWGKLGKIGAIAGAALAAIPSGGASLAAIPAISKLGSIAGAIGKGAQTVGNIGQVAGGIAGGMSEGRNLSNKEALERDRLMIEQSTARQRAEMDKAGLLAGQERDAADIALKQRQFGMTAPQIQAKQAMLGDMMSRFQDRKINVPGGRITPVSFSGGFSPSAILGPNSRAAGEEMGRQALLSLMSGDKTKFDPYQKFTPNMLDPVTVREAEKAGTLEKIMGGVGMAGSLAGAINPGGATQGASVPNAARIGAVNDPTKRVR